MRRHAPQMAGLLGPECLLIEFGSGSSLKTRLLLDHLRQPAGYVPVDISRGHLLRAARALAAAYPDVRIMPVCADYTYPLRLPPAAVGVERKVVYFPGSTIGNFAPEEARVFLLRARELTGAAGGLLIGVDLKKDPRILHAAYNDSAGVTAEFNLNLLARINRELAGDFDLERFAHYAFYHPSPGRIEMHLVSLADQTVRVAGETFSFNRGESIFTESSWKYTVEEFRRLAAQAGYRLQQVWTDEERLFSVQLFVSG
jgi:dimethylhistidine N-methyltransferase